MKRSPPPPPRRSFFLPVVLVLSLVANFVLAWRLTLPPGIKAPTEPASALLPYAALGSNMAELNRLPDLKWTEPQLQAYLNGIRASWEGRGYPLDEEARQLRDAFSARVQAMLAAERPDPTEQYFKALRDKEGVQRTASNLHYRMTLEGTGEPPQPQDTVVVSYSSRLQDGTEVGSLSGVRVRVAVRDLMPGLAEGVQLMRPGGKALFYVPANLSYRDGTWPPDVPPGWPVAVFLELHEVIAP
jgi:FKBP-type peptidyl-prolyl cis-trans isomerase